jgi:hypothetical protein
MAHPQSLYWGRAYRKGQHQQVLIRGKAGHHSQQLDIEAVLEVRDTRAALQKVGHILTAPTVGTRPINHCPQRGQPAPARKDGVKQQELFVHHKR